MKYDSHFLMTEADAIDYAKDYLKFFEADEKLVVKYGNVGVMEVKVNGEPVSMQGEQGVAIKTYTK